MKRILNSKFLIATEEKETSLLIYFSKNEHRIDNDGLNNFASKKIKHAIVRALAILVNKCFEEKIFMKC